MTKTNILVVGLTILAYCSILNIVKRKNKKTFSMVIGSQMDFHNISKSFLQKPFNTTKNKISQMKKHEHDNRIDILVLEDTAYWISNNVFYSGDIVDGHIDHDTTKPINTENMQKEEIDKMLFIIDNLKNGSNNDFGGTRH